VRVFISKIKYIYMSNRSIEDTSLKVQRTGFYKIRTKHFPWCFPFITYITRIHTYKCYRLTRLRLTSLLQRERQKPAHSAHSARCFLHPYRLVLPSEIILATLGPSWFYFRVIAINP
jgi:hypothetical protein